MRLDYFCPVYVETGSGKALTDPRKLQKLAGHIDNDPDSVLTLYMEEELSGQLVFDPVILVFDKRKNALYARVGFHEKEQLSNTHVEQLSEFVIGQFMDGYGDNVWSFRKGLSKYHIHFVSFKLKPNVLDYQQKEFQPFPVEIDEQLSSYSLLRGPFKTDAPLPIPKPSKTSPDKVIHQLHSAAMGGDLERIRKIVESGVNPDARPLKVEAHVPDYSALCWASNRNQIDAARYLISKGANLDFPAESGTPLMATQAPEMIQLLLEAGADPSVQISGMTAADYHRGQASFYLQDDGGLHSDLMKTQGEDMLALAELIEKWK